MSDWQPRAGMDPSPYEARVLLTLVQLWARINNAYGPQISELQWFLRLKWEPWKVSITTVRAHLTNLETKGHVYRWDRRKQRGLVTWQPTFDGHKYVLELLSPEYVKWPTRHHRTQAAERLGLR